MRGGISPWQAWMMAARPKTLPASLSPVAVGMAAAGSEGVFALPPSAGALAGALLLQIGVNLANDYFDFRRGIDTAGRKGPLRVTQAGLIAPARVRGAMILVLSAAALVGVYLVGRGGWPILLAGIASILAALAYSGGPWPLASHGLGDACVFVFFGPVAVCGTFYVQSLTLPPLAAASSLAPGFLITAILVVNNLRDIGTDARAGKRTLAVRIGREASVAEYALLVSGAVLSLPLVAAAGGGGAAVLLPLLSLPRAVPLIDALERSSGDGPAMNDALAGTARFTLLFCLLLALGLVL